MISLSPLQQISLLFPWLISNIPVNKIPSELFVDVYEVKQALQKLKVSKSPGPAWTPKIVLKSFAFELATVIYELYNSSLIEGYLPPLYKSAAVRPLAKHKPARAVENDIRPVSLTCQLAKVLEGFTLLWLTPPVLTNLGNKQALVCCCIYP